LYLSNIDIYMCIL